MFYLIAVTIYKSNIKINRHVIFEEYLEWKRQMLLEKAHISKE